MCVNKFYNNRMLKVPANPRQHPLRNEISRNVFFEFRLFILHYITFKHLYQKACRIRRQTMCEPL